MINEPIQLIHEPNFMHHTNNKRRVTFAANWLQFETDKNTSDENENENNKSSYNELK